MIFEASFDLGRIQRDLVYSWLTGTYWSPKLRRDVFETAFNNSLILGVYTEGDIQVAVARVITDRATFAWICDVFVDPDFRGQGISKLIMRTLTEHPELQTLRKWCLATKDAHGLYEQFGFAPAPPGSCMVRPMPKSAWQEAD